ncbi:MAG: hypothetical protein DWQ07_17115 [Chloroflexi bacterium]|nr:MAG: hypothetical protein DWQ07_17115 [Chloroflexota bacterium]MBL1195126.1 hypothetical protein [Chloroflexota bacterium]
MKLSQCPTCLMATSLGQEPQLGACITCEYCETELRVVSLNPCRLGWRFRPDERKVAEEYFEDEYGDNRPYSHYLPFL